MEDKFLDTLKSFSIQDLLNDQRPTTSRLLTARGPRPGTSFGGGAANNGFLGGGGGGIVEGGDGHYKTKTGGRVKTSWGSRPKTTMLGTMRPGTSSSKGPIKFSAVDETVDFIPDLSEMEEEDFAMTIASAPRVEAQRISSLTELDAELVTRKAFSVVRNVDLRKLTKFLLPEKDLVENNCKLPPNLSEDPEEAIWQCTRHLYDTLFTEVSTMFEEKQSDRGTSIWEDEVDETEEAPPSLVPQSPKKK